MICSIWKCLLLSHVQLFATSWTIACQTPLFMEFSRQEYWSRLPLPSTGDLPDPGIEPRSLAWWTDSLPSEPQVFIFFKKSKFISQIFRHWSLHGGTRDMGVIFSCWVTIFFWKTSSILIDMFLFSVLFLDSYVYSFVYPVFWPGLDRPLEENNLIWLYFPSINQFCSSPLPILLKKTENFRWDLCLLYQCPLNYTHWPIWDSFCHLLLWAPFLSIFGVLVSLIFLSYVCKLTPTTFYCFWQINWVKFLSLNIYKNYAMKSPPPLAFLISSSSLLQPKFME